MIDLKKLGNGKQRREPRVLVYGFEGIGKTGFAAGAPDPFFLDLNRGSFAYDVQRVMPDSWSETMEWIHAVESGQVKCKSVVLDVLSDLEHLGNQEFFPNTTIDKYEGGYGKGKTVALVKWRELLGALERVWNGGKAIIFVGHAKVKHFDDPSGPGYDRFAVSMNEDMAGLVKGWTDYNLFCREEVAHQKVGGGDVKAVSTGIRYAYTRRCPAYDAKARGTTEFPEKFPLSWSEFTKTCAADEERARGYIDEINKMLAAIGDKALETRTREYLRANPGLVVQARGYITSLFNDKQAATSGTAETKAGETK